MDNPLTAEKEIPSREVALWIALFGFDLGVPLMLPDPWKFWVGVTATGLSLIALIWSRYWYRWRDYGPVITIVGLSLMVWCVWHFHVLGVWYEDLIAFLMAGIAVSVVARLAREWQLAEDLDDTSVLISRYIKHLENQHSNLALLQLDEWEWTRVVRYYNRHYGKQASRLVRELANPFYKEFAKGITQPDSVRDLSTCAEMLAALSRVYPEWRRERLVRATTTGAIVGVLAFVALHVIQT
jgi:hypothetical protein